MPIKSDPEQWKDRRQILGLEGEELAKEFLQNSGWKILEHRFRLGRLEVDLIAEKDGLVAFVEVKTRWSTKFGDPVEAVTWGKRREIIKVAQGWMDRFGRGKSVRFDVIGIRMRRGKPVLLRHIADAFRSGWR